MDEKFELLLEERTQERSEPRTVSGLGEMGEVGVDARNVEHGVSVMNFDVQPDGRSQKEMAIGLAA